MKISILFLAKKSSEAVQVREHRKISLNKGKFFYNTGRDGVILRKQG